MLTAAEVQSWSWRFIRVVLAVFLAVVCFGVALVPIMREVSRRTPSAWRLRLATRSNLVSDVRVVPLPDIAAAHTIVSLNLDAGEPARGSVAVTLSRAELTAIQRVIADTGDRIGWRAIAYAFVAGVEYGPQMLSPTALSFELAEDAATGVMRVQLREEPFQYDRQRIDVRVGGASNIRDNTLETHLFTHGVHVITANEEPLRQSDPATVLVGHQNLRFVVLSEAQPQEPTTTRQRVRDVISKFDFRYLYVVQPLVIAILYSIPFALLIALLRRVQEDEAELDPTRRFPAARFMKLAVTFIVLFLGLGLGRAGLDLYFDPSSSLRANLLDSCGQAFVNSSGAAALGAAFVFWFWPSFARRARKETLGTSSRGARITFWVLLILAAAAMVTTATLSCTGTLPLQYPALGAALVASIFGVAAASAEVTSGGQALLSGISTIVVAITIELVDVMFAPPNFAASALMAILAVPLLFSLLRIFIPKWHGWTLFAAALLFASLLVIAPTPTYNLWWQVELLTLASELSPALRLIAAIFLLTLLRHLSKTGKWAVLERSERDAGIVLAVTFFFLPSHQWLLIIVSFSLGWLLLQKWVFVPRNITADGETDAPATIRDVIRFHEAALALRMMKKDLRAKLAKAELAFHEYERHVRGLEAFVDELRARIEPRGNGAPAAVLSSGNPMAPWERGAMGARYGLLFAIPWLALFVRDFHAGFAPERVFAWVAALGTALQAMGQWPLLGFFFGYFYPHLRGETGLSKGLYLFLAVVTPTFAATALAAPTSAVAWTSFSFWALQLFIHCMLLGFFAGDYETLRASGLGFRHLVDVHNLGALTAWGSGLLLAIGAAATTAATTQAGALLMQALQTVVPELRK